MDAKAKVVRWECRPLNWEVQYQQRDDGEWVKFTDHEAALAELAIERDAFRDAKDITAASREHWKTKCETLLTGLEALAGECDGIEGLGSAVIAQRIRMLVSSVGQSNERIDKSREQRVLAMAADLLDTHGATVAAIAVRTVAKNIDPLASAGLEGKDVPR